MGIYPVTEQEKLKDGKLKITYDNFSGLVTTTYYEPILVIEERTNCFCCSCGRWGEDPACRNHGWAAKRPCEEHDMPGSPWEASGEMPESVQVERAKGG